MHLRMGVPLEQIGLFPRGIDSSLFNVGRRDVDWRREVLHAKSTDTVILWTGRLVLEKGIDLFADTLALLAERGTQNYRVAVIGDGPARSFFEQRVDMNKTTFVGHQSGTALARAYASSDIFFFPSLTEAFPNVMLEAMSSGLSVIAPNISVNRGFIKSEKNGVLVDETRSAPAFADNLVRLIGDTSLRQAIATRAHDTAASFTWDRAFGSLLGNYDRCIAAKGIGDGNGAALAAPLGLRGANQPAAPLDSKGRGFYDPAGRRRLVANASGAHPHWHVGRL